MIPVKMGRRQSHEGLTLFPLFPTGDAGSQPSWTLLEDALGAGWLEVTEVDEGGVVGELAATNHGPAPVLILDGEQLIGAKQNRTTSRTILVGAGGRTTIPVSCMEHGRWHHTSAAMRHGGEHSPSSVRRHARQVEAREAEETRGRRYSELRGRRSSSPSELLAMAQGAVWDSVAESSARAGVRSDTGALDAVYAGRRESLEERAARFAARPGQIGVLAMLFGVPVALDLLPGQGIYAKVHDRLVRAYLFQALDGSAGLSPEAIADWSAKDADRKDGRAFLAAALKGRREPMETVGLGLYSVVSAGDVFGGELTLDGELVHLSAFNALV